MRSDLRNQVTSARWRRIEELYHLAKQRDDKERDAFLAQACGGDEGLRREVESILGYAAEAEHFMESVPEVQADAGATLDSASITEGLELGSYKILSLLGAGGMGKVYLARDTRLGRTVAIKILAREKVAHSERKRRFMQEARAASALNHPNIVTIYDIASHSDTDFLVMEYVEGQSLHQRISPRGLPIQEALRYATQIAGALAAAHAAGIVHRDLKPANVMVTEKGVVKVLDFGLAKLSDWTDPTRTNLPTDATRTQRGVILGTAAYMSPEQAAGKPVDARSDIFAMGLVLYEMITGRRAFDKGSVLATLGAVLYEEPVPLGTLVKAAPPELVKVVERCLKKDPDRRIQTMADLKVALEEVEESLENPRDQPAVPARPGTRVKPWMVVAGSMMVLLAATLFLMRRPDAPQSGPVTNHKPLTSMNGWEVAPSWSPDGSLMAFSNNKNGNMDIFMMPTAGGNPVQLTETSYDEVSPRWSPDFKHMAYVADPGTGANVYLKPPASLGDERVLVATGLQSVERFADTLQVLGSMPWSQDSQELLYSRATDAGGLAIWRINVTTRVESQVTFPKPGESDFNATWSFDGQRIAFDRGSPKGYTLWTVPANGGQPRLLSQENYFGGSTWTGDSKRILFISFRGGDRHIWEIEADSGQLRQITTGPTWDQFPVVSRGGRLAYVKFGPHNVNLYQVRADPAEDLGRVTAHSGESFFPSFSQDGKRLVYQSDQTGNAEIYLMELGSKQNERNLTGNMAGDFTPHWSPDGREIAFISTRDGKARVWIMDAEGGSPRPLSSQYTVPEELFSWIAGSLTPRWSPDGKLIAFIAAVDSGTSLMVIGRDGSNPRRILDRVLYFDWYDPRHIIIVRRGTDNRASISSVDLDNGNVTLLLADPAIELAVSRDRTRLLYTHAESHFNMNLHVVTLRQDTAGRPIAAGKPKQITNGGNDWHVHKGDWSPDGTTIVYTRDSDQGDIFTIEDFR